MEKSKLTPAQLEALRTYRGNDVRNNPVNIENHTRKLEELIKMIKESGTDLPIPLAKI